MTENGENLLCLFSHGGSCIVANLGHPGEKKKKKKRKRIYSASSFKRALSPQILDKLGKFAWL